MSQKSNSVLLLLALVPAPSLGVLCGMVWFPDTAFGKLFFGATKIWMFALPLVWWWRNRSVERGLPRGNLKHGITVSVLAGVAVFAVIVAAYALLGGHFIDRELFADKIRSAGFGDKRVYLVLALYWVCVNSLLEEIVWRRFVTERFARLCGGGVPPFSQSYNIHFAATMPIILSALCFTLHHTLAMGVFFPVLTNLLASAGVFAGGVLFSWFYMRWKSIWPPYVAHVFADVAVFGIGWRIMFYE